MNEITIDFSIRASECLGYCTVQKDFVKLTDLKTDDDSKGLKRRIIAITEGIHNMMEFRASEIEAMIKRAHEIKEQEKRNYFKVPLVLDHSWQFLDKVGATYNLEFGTDPERKIPAAIADVEFWNSTPLLKEVAARVKHDPENTFFSVRVRGQLKSDDKGDYLADMTLIHIAPVNEPADPNARLISNFEVAENKQSHDFSLNSSLKEVDNMTGDTKIQDENLQKRLTDLEQKITDLASKFDEAFKKTEQTTAQDDTDDKLSLMADIISADPGVDREFIKSLSKAQLEKYKADFERKAGGTDAGKKTTEKSVNNGTPQPTAEELAEKYFGPVEVM